MSNEISFPQTLDGLAKQVDTLSQRLERVELRVGITPPVVAPETPPVSPAPPAVEEDTERNRAAKPVGPGAVPDERSWVPLPDPTPQPARPRPSVVPPVTPLPEASPVPLPGEMGIPAPPVPQPQKAVPASSASASPLPVHPAPVPTPAQAGAGRDWENLIGGKWALWVGLFSLFLAIASFLAYTWKSLPPAPPSVRLALGIGAGLGMMGAGSFFRQRAQRWFSEGLLGGGLAVLYLSIWVGAQQYHLLSFTAAFPAMALITMMGVYLAVRHDALSLSMLATLGGFLTPIMLSGGAGAASGAMSLLTYIAVLNTGILGVSLFKRWYSLSWLSFCGTVLLVVGWADGNYNPSALWTVFACITLYFLMYVATACFYSLVHREETSSSDLLLLLASAAMYALGGYMLLFGNQVAYPALFVLALAVLFGLLARATAIIAPRNVALQRTAVGIALLMITLAFPIHFKGAVLAVSWCVEAAVLLILGIRLRSRLLQAAGHWVWGLSLLGVMSAMDQNPNTSGWLFINQRALPLLVSVVTIALVLAQHWAVVRQRPNALQDDAPASPDIAARPVLIDSFASFYAVYLVSGGAWLLAQETYLWFQRAQQIGFPHWQVGANYVIAALLAIYAVTAFLGGLRGRDKVVRQSALAVLALTVCIPVCMPMWTGLSAKTPDWLPFWNLRLLSYMVIAISLGVTGWLAHRYRAVFESGEPSLMRLWPVASGCFFLLGATIELYSGFEAARGSQWKLNAAFAVAILWSVGAVLMAQAARVLRLGTLRQTALVIGISGGLLTLAVSPAYDSAAAPLVWNMRGLAFGTVSLLLIVTALGAKRQTGAGQKGWPDTTVACALLGCLMLLWGVSQESYSAFVHYQAALGRHWKLQAGFFLSVLWGAAALGLLGGGLRWKQIAFRGAAYLLLPLAFALLLYTTIDAVRLGWMPFFNARFITFVLLSGFSGGAALQLHRHADRLVPWEKEWAGAFGWLAGTLLLWGLTQELYESCYFYREALGSYWTRWAQMLVSLTWSVYGTALLIAGINRSFKPLRLAALGLLCCTVVKVFLFDLGFLSGPLRMFSLAGLGLALIFISWLYSRYGKGEDIEHSTSNNEL